MFFKWSSNESRAHILPLRMLPDYGSAAGDARRQSKYVPVPAVPEGPHILSGSDRLLGREMNLKRVCG